MAVSRKTPDMMTAVPRRIQTAMLLTVLAFSPAAAGNSGPPDPAQGSVDSSGKFVPAKPAGESPKVPANPGEWRQEASRLIEKTGDHSFRVGLVRCDRAERLLVIPAKVNLREGLIEYALVAGKGKVHEALLSTEADPLHVQMAALLLGIAPGEGKTREVSIEVEWATNGPRRKVAIEELVALAKDTPRDKTGSTMARGAWNFTGSRIDAQGFAASREGSFIALIEDPAALIVNPRPGNEDDSLHVPNSAALPAEGIPVSVIVRWKAPDPPAADPPAKP